MPPVPEAAAVAVAANREVEPAKNAETASSSLKPELDREQIVNELLAELAPRKLRGEGQAPTLGQAECEAFYGANHAKALAFARSILRDRQACEDALGQTFLELLEGSAGADTGGFEAHPKAWVLKFRQAQAAEDRKRIFLWALKNKCLDDARRRQFEQGHFVSLDELEEQENEADDTGSRCRPLPSVRENPDAGLEQEAFRRAVLELPIMLAVIVHLLPLVDGNASELARQLGIPQRHMARHLARIRTHFTERGLGT
jgi:RNA polymerase sigma factor (sigma-70 family)